MPDYDSFLFKPPAPVAFVTLLNPENNLEKPRVPMLLDSGADLTLIPVFAIESLGLNFLPNLEIKLESFDGQKSVSRAVDLYIFFEEQKFRANFPVIEENYGVIGRNILNRFKIELDGQNLSWRIL